MCGIATIFSPNATLFEINKENMFKALDLQKHRGPDATGIWRNDNVVLGHNRLSIIDLSHGADQPLARPDLGIKIIFNGEIYNYKILKEILLQKGYSFLTSSDTEVLLVGFFEFGPEICSKLVGMFSFIIYNENDNSLFIGKDRFGEKPLFYIEENGVYYFASELNALRTLYSKELTINHDAVIDIMENMYINPIHTIYNEVSNFNAGSYLTINEKGKEWNKYYKIPNSLTEQHDFNSLKAQTKEKLYRILEDELNADVNVATFLSSGVDSTLITAIAKDIKPDIVAVTIATGEETSDESQVAKRYAKKLNVKHEIVNVDVGSLNLLSNILKDIQPLADASLIPSFMVTDHVKNEFKVMLSGDGGDEVFGSYNKPNLFRNLKYRGNTIGKLIVRTALSSRNSWIESKSRSKLNDKNRMMLAGWDGYYQGNNLNNSILTKVFAGGKKINFTKKIFDSLKVEFADNQEKISFAVDLLTRLPGDFLYKVDSAAMHSSVEVRAPFLDHTLVDFIMKVPVGDLMPDGIDKQLTKAILADYIGTHDHSPKKGFTIPYSDFMREKWGDILDGFLQEDLSSDYFKFNVDGIKGLLQDHRLNPSPILAKILFSILVLEIWLRVFHLKTSVEQYFS